MNVKKIGVLLFDEVELLDFAGPIQVFSSLGALYPELEISVTTFSFKRNISISKIGMTINVDHKIEEIEYLDLLIIPGGMGTRELVKQEDQLRQVTHLLKSSRYIASVCTGSLVLAKLGVLKGLNATTHFAATHLLTKLDPSIKVDRSKRFHDHETVIIAEGVSAGIDMSFYLVEKWFSKDTSDSVRKYIEYYPEKK